MQLSKLGLPKFSLSQSYDIDVETGIDWVRLLSIDGVKLDALESKRTGGDIVGVVSAGGRFKTKDAILVLPRAQRSKRAECMM